MVAKCRHYNIKMTSSCDAASHSIQELLGAYLKDKNEELKRKQRKLFIICIRGG